MNFTLRCSESYIMGGMTDNCLICFSLFWGRQEGVQDGSAVLVYITLVSASDGTPTGRPRSIHWPSDRKTQKTCDLRIITSSNHITWLQQLPGLGTVFMSLPGSITALIHRISQINGIISSLRVLDLCISRCFYPEWLTKGPFVKQPTLLD